MTSARKRRVILTMCAFVAAPLVFVTGDVENMFSSGDGPIVLVLWLAVSAAVCTWWLAPNTLSGTRSDVFTGVIAGLFSALLTPVLFGFGLGFYAFFASFKAAGILSGLAMVLYIPVVFFVGAILFFGAISLPIAAAAGGLVYSPLFGRKSVLPKG